MRIKVLRSLGAELSKSIGAEIGSLKEGQVTEIPDSAVERLLAIKKNCPIEAIPEPAALQAVPDVSTEDANRKRR